jgi:nitrogen fixation-related uncharacterized protein
MDPTLPPPAPAPPPASAPFGTPSALPYNPPAAPAVPGPAYGYGPVYGGYGPQRRRSGLAVAAMVLGIVGVPLFMLLVPALLALVFGVVSLRQVRESAGRVTGRGMAVTGIVLGTLSLAGGGLFWWAGATGRLDDENGNSVFDDPAELVVGDCYDLPDSGEFGVASRVACGEPHDGQYFHSEALRKGREDFPGTGEVERRSEEACGRSEFTEFVGVPIEESRYSVFYLAPAEFSWTARDGEVQCFVANYDESPIIGSVEGIGE